MAKTFRVNKFENGDATNVDATRKEILDILNDSENRPEIFKDVSKTFSYFNFHSNPEGGYKELLIRLSDPVTKEVASWVNTVFGPSRSEDFDRDLVIRQYRTPKKRIKTKQLFFALLNEIVAEEKPEERKRKSKVLVEKVKTLW
jgi:hypothetical protein